jgi:hypothetical protein
MDAGERFLGDVLRLIVVGDYAVGNIIGLLHVALDKETECFAASCLRIENQSPLVIGGHPVLSLCDVPEVRHGRRGVG